MEAFSGSVVLCPCTHGAFSTVTVQEADLLPAVAVMVAVPGATAVTLPLLSTVATDSLFEVHVTVSVVSEGSTVATSVSVLPV